MIQHPAADVVVMGLGTLAGTIAAELSLAGYKVAGVTRGPYWNYANDFSQMKYDEWGVGVNRRFDLPLPYQSHTIRNDSDQFALPVRRYTHPIQYHALGHGVGGAAHHYGGTMGRMGPTWYQLDSFTTSKYGLAALNAANPNSDVIDWPASYFFYEPYYVEWEKAMGLCGNLNGNTLVPMSVNYPLPPHPLTEAGTSFQSATEALGYSPFPHVSSLASKPYTNQYGVQVNACVYDGWCGGSCNYPCEVGAKANSAFRTIPAAIKTGNFTMALESHIFRADTNSQGLVTQIRYYDLAGNVHVQPGTAFFNGLWGYNQVRAMLLSGIGVPYNPTKVTGTVGRGLTNGYSTYSSTTGPSGTLPIGGNAYPAGNGSGGGVDLYGFMDDNFDHTGLGFFGGFQASVGTYSGGGPGNASFAGGASATMMGGSFKAAQKNRYLFNSTHVGLGGPAPDLATTRNYFDLNPHYYDVWGDPLTRETHSWTNNQYAGATYWANGGSAVLQQILTAMGCSNITSGGTTVAPGAAVNDWWGHHLRGGNRVSKSASTGTFNQWQQCWTAPNLFAAGEVNNSTGDTVPSGTHQAGPQAQIASEGIQMYLKSPGLL